MALDEHGIPPEESPASTSALFGFGLALCAIFVPVLYLVARAGEGVASFVTGLFALFGTGMVYQGVRQSLQQIKYGEARLVLLAEPRVGGRLHGRVEFPGGTADSAMVDAELICRRVAWERSVKSRSLSDLPVRITPGRFALQRTANRSSATLTLAVPADLSPSDHPRDEPGTSGIIFGTGGLEFDREYHRWEVRVTADVPGLDPDWTFRIKMLPASASSIALAPAHSPQASGKLLLPPIDARMGRLLARFAFFIGMLPFAALVTTGIAAFGAAGCPMQFSLSAPPNCAWAGIDWSLLLAATIEHLHGLFAASALTGACLWLGGLYWIARSQPDARAVAHVGTTVAVLALGALIAFDARLLEHAVLERQRLAALPPPPQPAPPAPPARWTTDTSGWEIPLPKGAYAAGIGGRGMRLSANGKSLVVAFERIVIEKHPGLTEVAYRSVSAHFRQDYKDGGKSGVSKEWLQGRLTAEAPVATVENHAFEFSGASECAIKRCHFYLEVEAAPVQ
jgi:hypothetical protein